MWDFKNFNLENFLSGLQDVDFSFCNDIKDLDETVDHWTNLVLNTASETIPNKLVRIRYRDKPWFNGYLRRLLRKKKRLFKKAKLSNNLVDWDNFKTNRNLYFRKCKERKDIYEKARYRSLVEEGVNNPKKWWSLLKECMGIKRANSIPPILNNNSLINEDIQKAELFNDYFSSVTNMDLDNAPNISLDEIHLPDNVTLNNIIISEEEVLDQLTNS